MNRWQRWSVAGSAFVFCLAASQYAMRGIHGPTQNQGYLGTEVAGVEGVTPVEGSKAVFGRNTGSGSLGYLGFSKTGVYGSGEFGVLGEGSTLGVFGKATTSSPDTAGVRGQGPTGVLGISEHTDGFGVRGEGSIGVRGDASHDWGIGVNAESLRGFAVRSATSFGTAIYGLLHDPAGHAGYFEGRVHVNGNLSKSSGTFKIDHPLDPANKFLYHSMVESPDMKNFYDGVVTLAHDGTAVVELPEWFEALNEDFRYQLTCIGEHAPVYIASKIQDNRFMIAGGFAGMEVSWQVTGNRHDAYAKAHPTPVEEIKAPDDAGRYLNPEVYDQPVSLRIGNQPGRPAVGSAPPSQEPVADPNG